MKKVNRYFLALGLSFIFGITALSASNTLPAPVLSSTPTSTVDPRVQELTQRLDQIQAMDKSQLTPKERKALRKETRQIKRAVSGGVYISAGTIIIILLLLILLT